MRLKKRGVPIETVIDVGASDGRWSRSLSATFPQATYFLVEAQECHLPGLHAFKADFPHSDFVLAAAGDQEGEIFFDASDPFGGVASHEQMGGDERKVVRVPVTTIDHEVKARSLAGPFLIKLDTHGFEVPILSGASETLAQASAVIIEVYNFDITEGVLRFPDMISLMERNGFRVADMFDPVYRPHDGMLWQMDLLFLRADRPEFGNNSYQ
ncbi:MAG: FkbM family methyltransferase [Pseudomonadota bacterium]